MIEVIATDREPLERSKGGQNGYAFWCGEIEELGFYSTCLNVHAAIGDDRIGTTFSRCQKAFESDACPAIKMREEEVNADRAIYFESFRDRTNRHKRDETQTPVRNRPTISFETTKVARSVKPVKSGTSNQSQIVEFNAAAVVNDLAKIPKVSKSPVSVESSEATLRPKPGESPLHFARRLNEFKKEKSNVIA